MKPTSRMLPLLFFAAATHFLVDFVSGTLNPLWPRFDSHFHLVAWQSAAIFFVWQMTTSVSQFVFGVYGDRFNVRWLFWAGPVAAIVCLGSIGLTQSPLVLALLLTISGLGVAAYHPEAAALAGSCAPEHRSRAMSVFTMGGFMGQAIGPIYSGMVVDKFGLGGLVWGIAGGLLAAAVLVPFGRGTMRGAAHAAAAPVRLSDVLRGRMGPMLLVLVIGSLRIVAAAGVPVLLGFLLETRGLNAQATGVYQGEFMLGIGLGGLACATLLRSHHERMVLWICPAIVTPLLIAIPWLRGGLLGATICASGFLLGVSLPVLISFGQQLMPNSQRIASSITMGVSWGLGGGVVSLILAGSHELKHYEPAFFVFAVATAFSSVLCWWLPDLSRVSAPVTTASTALSPVPMHKD